MPQNLPSSERGDFESLVPAGDLPKPSCGGCDVVSTILSTIVLDTAVKNGFLGPSIRYHANSLKPFNEGTATTMWRVGKGWVATTEHADTQLHAPTEHHRPP